MILSLLLALTPDASAIDYKWWGAGPQISTMLFPSAYPVSFPAGAKEDGKAGNDPLVDKVGFDLNIAGRAVLYPTSSGRLGARLQFGFGANAYANQEFTLEYELTLKKQGTLQVLAGGGIGVGHERFHSLENEGYLNVSYYPIRAEISGLLRDNTRAYELGLWVTYHIAGSQNYYENANDLKPTDGKGDSLIAGSLYFGLGLEATVFFGDFKTDGKKSNNNSSSKSKDKNKKSSSGSSGGSLK